MNMRNPLTFNSLARYALAALLSVGAMGVFLAASAYAQDAAPAASTELPVDGKYIMNTLLFLVTGFLVMWMAAGFAMLEAGMVRTKNVAMQCTKNIVLYSICGVMFWLIGYNVMYPGDGWLVQNYLGSFTPKVIPAPNADPGDYAAASDWFFQMVFCATACSIVSGSLAERIKLWPFLIFCVVLTGVIYPIEGSWDWGAGWLDDMGFSDFAGSTIVHSTGGWCALSGAIILGARIGKYGPGGEVRPIPGSSMSLATLGTFILWLGWFGFNGGSQLAMGTLSDASSVARIFVNTNNAAAAGVVVAVILTQVFYGKVDLTMALNGALGGLVAITAEPLTPSVPMALVVGGIGAAIVVVTVPLLDKMRIDDVVGAIPVHLFAGIWGTMAVPLTNPDASFAVQATGIIAIGIFVTIASTIVWLILAAILGLRPTAEEEMAGLDQTEIGIEAYPEFGRGSQIA